MCVHVQHTSVQEDIRTGGLPVEAADIERWAQVRHLVVGVGSVGQQGLHTLAAAYTHKLMAHLRSNSFFIVGKKKTNYTNIHLYYTFKWIQIFDFFLLY